MQISPAILDFIQIRKQAGSTALHNAFGLFCGFNHLTSIHVSFRF